MSSADIYDGSAPLENAGHERFAQEYLIDLCGGRAYERAGYKSRGHVADSAAYRLLTNVDIKKRIAFLKEERRTRLGIDADRVLEEMAVIAYQNLDHYRIYEDGNVTLAEDAPDSAIRALSSIKRKITMYQRGDTEVKEVNVDIKTWSKDRQLENLAKHLGLLGPRGTKDDPVHEHRVTEIRIITDGLVPTDGDAGSAGQ